MGSRDLTTMREFTVRLTSERMIVMQAYLDGRQIESRMRYEDGTFSEWAPVDYPSWVWEWFEYREQGQE